MKILVTGGAGFIGSHIVESLVEMKHEVIVYDNFSSGFRENLENVKDKIDIIVGDILDQKKLENACRGVDYISHQAAQLEIMKCIKSPQEDLKINTEGTLNVFEAARNNEVKKIVYASSACVYGQAEEIPEKEDHPKQPNWSYGVSKYATELYADIYHHYYNIDMVGLRYAIIYGPREWYGRVLTSFLKRALEKELPIIWGEGGQQRDFTYVSDAVTFHNLSMFSSKIKNEIFNVSTGKGTSIKNLAMQISSNFSLGEPIFENIQEGEESKYLKGRKRIPAELKVMILDNSKAKKFGWSPEIELNNGIMEEYNWAKENKNRWQKMHY